MTASLQVVSDRSAMDTDKQKALDAALAQIDRAFGKGSAMRLGSREAIEIETISTGSLGLDIALGIGGAPEPCSRCLVPLAEWTIAERGDTF
jgi:recombination protein RecA